MSTKIRKKKPGKKVQQRAKPRRQSSRYTTGELFLAVIGAALVLLVVGMVVSSMLE